MNNHFVAFLLFFSSVAAAAIASGGGVVVDLAFFSHSNSHNIYRKRNGKSLLNNDYRTECTPDAWVAYGIVTACHYLFIQQSVYSVFCQNE